MSFKLILSGIAALLGLFMSSTGIINSILISIIIFISNLITYDISDFIKKNFAPDTIYYSQTSDLVKTRVFWSWGIYVLSTIITAGIALETLPYYKWWKICLILIGVSILIFAIESSKNSKIQE